jgi:SprT protein
MNATEAKHHVRKRVRDITEQANKLFGVNMIVPSVAFSVRGQVAGRARYALNEVDFNQQLMLENWDKFDQTIVHEVAHLVTRRVYGIMAKAHGHEWKSVMVRLGANPARCHQYDVANSTVQRTKYSYVCPSCNTVYHVGAKRHKKITQFGAKYRCKCRGANNVITFLGVKPREVARTQTELCNPTNVVSLLSRFGTKKAAAEYIINTNPSMSRAQIINKLVADLDMSKAGAASYYWTLTK